MPESHHTLKMRLDPRLFLHLNVEGRREGGREEGMGEYVGMSKGHHTLKMRVESCFLLHLNGIGGREGGRVRNK
jgi:hypothetical protein